MDEGAEALDLQRCIEAFRTEMRSGLDPLTFKSFQGALLLSYTVDYIITYNGVGQEQYPWAMVMLFSSCIEVSTLYLSRVHAFFAEHLQRDEIPYWPNIKHDPSVYSQFTNLYGGPREIKYLTELHRYIEATQESESWNDLLFQISYNPSTPVPCCYFVFALGCLWESIAINVHSALPFENMCIVDLRVHDEYDLMSVRAGSGKGQGERTRHSPLLASTQELSYHPLLQACPLLFLQEGDVQTPRIVTLITTVLETIDQFTPLLSMHRRIGSGVFKLGLLKRRLRECQKLCLSALFRRKMEVRFGFCVGTMGNVQCGASKPRSGAGDRNRTSHRWIGSALKMETYKKSLEYLSDLERFITDDSCEAISASSESD